MQSRREEDVVAMRNAKNTIIPSNPMEPEPEPVHQGQTNIIPYNAPKVQGHEAAKNQPVRVQEQAAAPQPINEGAFSSEVVHSGFGVHCSRPAVEQLKHSKLEKTNSRACKYQGVLMENMWNCNRISVVW